MKVAVTSKGTDLDAPVDPRFGRAAYIIVVDSDTLGFEVIDNSENLNTFKGAGIQAAALISDKDAGVLLTGFCGPNAFTTLDAAGIKVVNDITGTVRQAVELYNQGSVKYAENANVEGHW